MAKRRNKTRKIRKQDIKYYAIALAIGLILTLISEWGSEDAKTSSSGQNETIVSTETLENMDSRHLKRLQIILRSYSLRNIKI
jgi:hypothetical protein